MINKPNLGNASARRTPSHRYVMMTSLSRTYLLELGHADEFPPSPLIHLHSLPL